MPSFNAHDALGVSRDGNFSAADLNGLVNAAGLAGGLAIGATGPLSAAAIGLIGAGATINALVREGGAPLSSTPGDDRGDGDQGKGAQDGPRSDVSNDLSSRLVAEARAAINRGNPSSKLKLQRAQNQLDQLVKAAKRKKGKERREYQSAVKAIRGTVQTLNARVNGQRAPATQPDDGTRKGQITDTRYRSGRLQVKIAGRTPPWRNATKAEANSLGKPLTSINPGEGGGVKEGARVLVNLEKNLGIAIKSATGLNDRQFALLQLLASAVSIAIGIGVLRGAIMASARAYAKQVAKGRTDQQIEKAIRQYKKDIQSRQKTGQSDAVKNTREAITRLANSPAVRKLAQNGQWSALAKKLPSPARDGMKNLLGKIYNTRVGGVRVINQGQRQRGIDWASKNLE